MIAAFARAARVLDGADGCLDQARQAARFIRERLWHSPERTLLRRFRQGTAGVEAYAEDYAYLIFGLLEIFQADGDPAWLEWAIELQGRQDELFADPDGGWFSTTGLDRSVLLRLKEDYDGAEPAAGSVSVLNLLTLSHLAGSAADAPRWAERIERTLGSLASHMARAGRATPMMLAALSTFHAGSQQLAILGRSDSADTARLHEVVRLMYRPFAVVVPVDTRIRERVAGVLPWIAGMRSIDGRATAYLCRDFACDAPTTDPDTLRRLLSA